MNTTTDTAATFTPNAVYSVPSLGIFYKIQFSEKGAPAQARLLDGSHVTEWLPIVPVSNEPGAAMVIDPNGYSIPVENCEQVPTPQGINNTLFTFRHKNADAPGFSGVTGSIHSVPGWRAAVERLKILFPYNWRDFVPQGIASRFPIVVEDSVYKLHNGTHYPVDMPDEVINIIAPTIGERKERFVFDFGDLDTGRSWNECFNTSGYIGRSTGRVKIPLLIHSRRSYGGPALMGSIVRVLTAKGKRVLYQHPNYHSLIWPKWQLTVKHDNGKIKFTTAAPDEESARTSICAAECCPPSAIIAVKRLS